MLITFGRKRLLWGVVAATAFAFLVRHFGATTDGTPADTNWYAFAAGAMVYFTVASASRLRRRLYGLFLIAAAAALAVRTPADVLFALHHSPQAGGLIGSVFAVTLLALRPLDGRLYGARVLAPLRWCGRRCYSLYLIHWPVCKIVAVLLHRRGLDEYAALWPLLTVPLSLLASHLFYVAVERRFLGARPEPPEMPHPPA
jgi:peptidoglycan/LPS O-acetylase OafA/YrhL